MEGRRKSNQYVLDIDSAAAFVLLDKLEKATGVLTKDISTEDIETLDLICNGGMNELSEFRGWQEQGLLRIIKPTCFADLVRLYGIAHDNGVWEGNSEILLNTGTASLEELITNRDDILLFLLEKGMPYNDAYRIMDLVRKGRGGRLLSKERDLLLQNGVPAWYIDSMEKIEYLFPKSQIEESMTRAFCIAWYKVHYEETFETVLDEC